jgi:hypothetical protein
MDRPDIACGPILTRSPGDFVAVKAVHGVRHRRRSGDPEGGVRVRCRAVRRGDYISNKSFDFVSSP